MDYNAEEDGKTLARILLMMVQEPRHYRMEVLGVMRQELPEQDNLDKAMIAVETIKQRMT